MVTGDRAVKGGCATWRQRYSLTPSPVRNHLTCSQHPPCSKHPSHLPLCVPPVQLQAHLRYAAHHPQASPGIDPSHLVALIHAASSLGHYHAPLYGTVAAALLPDLDELPTEELVLATWAYASTLRYASVDAATARPVLLHGGSGPLQQHLAVLRGLSDMLAAAVPQGRPDALLPGELQLLWQAQTLSEQWCRRGSGGDGNGMSRSGNSSHGMSGGDGNSRGDGQGNGSDSSGGIDSRGTIRASPLQLHPGLLEGGGLWRCLSWVAYVEPCTSHGVQPGWVHKSPVQVGRAFCMCSSYTYGMATPFTSSAQSQVRQTQQQLCTLIPSPEPDPPCHPCLAPGTPQRTK